MVKKGLGRSFDSLLPTELINETLDPTAGVDEKISQLTELKLEVVHPDPQQPRHTFDETALDELAASIKEHGVLQPIVVSPDENGYVIVAGERRWRASKKAGLTAIPAIVRSLNNQHRLEIALIENLQRSDLNALETATAYLKLRDQFNMKLEEIAQRIGGKSTASISNAIRLLQLPQNAKDALVAGEISEGHARQILALSDTNMKNDLLRRIMQEGWSVRRAEQFVIGYKKGQGTDKKSSAVRSTLTETVLTKGLSTRLKTSVKVKTTAHGGQLVIGYKNDDDLKRIVDSISK